MLGKSSCDLARPKQHADYRDKWSRAVHSNGRSSSFIRDAASFIRGSASKSFVADVCCCNWSLINGTIVSKLQRMWCLATKVIGIKRRVISERMRFAWSLSFRFRFAFPSDRWHYLLARYHAHRIFRFADASFHASETRWSSLITETPTLISFTLLHRRKSDTKKTTTALRGVTRVRGHSTYSSIAWSLINRSIGDSSGMPAHKEKDGTSRMKDGTKEDKETRRKGTWIWDILVIAGRRR